MNRHRKNLDSSLNEKTVHELNRTVYVGNFNYLITKEELHDHFSRIGGVSNIIIKRRDGMRAYSFVTFDDLSSAKKALNLHNSNIEGQSYPISVRAFKLKHQSIDSTNVPPTGRERTSNNQGLANGPCGEAGAATIALNNQGPPTAVLEHFYNQDLRFGLPRAVVEHFYKQDLRFDPPVAAIGTSYNQFERSGESRESLQNQCMRYGLSGAATGELYNQGARFGQPGYNQNARSGAAIDANRTGVGELYNQCVRIGPPRAAIETIYYEGTRFGPIGTAPGLHNQGVRYGLPEPRGALHDHLINPPAAPGLHNQGVRYGLPGPRGALHGHLINPPAAPGLHNQGVMYGLPGPNGPSHNQGPENSSNSRLYSYF